MSLSADVSMRLAAAFRSRVVITDITSRRRCHSRAPDHLILLIHAYVSNTSNIGDKETTYRIGNHVSINRKNIQIEREVENALRYAYLSETIIS